MIRAARKPMVHLITYGAPVTKTMLHFNGLSYYVLPRLAVSCTAPDWLSIELGIFAGRLYINFSECAPLTNYIQLADKTCTDYRSVARARRNLYQESCRLPTGVAYGLPQGARHHAHANGLYLSGTALARKPSTARSTGAREVGRPSGGGTSGDVDEAEDQDPDLEDE